MSYMDVDSENILATLRMAADAELAGLFYTLEDLYERKLWHQLSNTLAELYADPKSRGIRLRVYNRFVSNFAAKINQLQLVRFLLASLDECNGLEEALEYLTTLKKNIAKEEQQALLFVDIQIARFQLKAGQTDSAKEILKTVGDDIDRLDSLDNRINAAYYHTSAEVHKLSADHTAFYRTSLLYLACIDATELSSAEKQTIAYDIGVSALLGDRIYTFGELLTHDILRSLDDTAFAWVTELLFALNAGDLARFDALLAAHKSTAPVLAAQEPFLRQKICIMALVELVFSKPSNGRTLAFSEISAATSLDLDEVEHLVMKALSLGLIRGHINEVDGVVAVRWVQPRVMNKDQIQGMHAKLVAWDDSVRQLSEMIHANGQEIWTSV
ncbi:hypothetical protein BABINDRAFT_160612 [Babjeviella inositovora NRRL Y-12698]|uniref:PCI domain-containing protein n=1 Tax=Babjeviella inositovora NRRL Y-12698 TaxID=984486 RepID=A0A1E3QU71_9ASCO|nr:uncharacterized protein BABINDRAFT_160612 [Babjeviella inositovora NRRL Y-12698]ODQ81231.1 hypothetical protein BABINDRAFT_160612 [Babjeviella inositovora NRRL Y-12698]